MIVDIVLPALFVIYIVHGLVRLVKSYKVSKNRHNFFRSKPILLAIRILLIILIPLLAVELIPLNFHQSITEYPLIIGVIFSASISILWIVYIRKIDIYEQERWVYIVLVFALSCITIWLVFPISGLINDLGFNLNGNPINDFLYCTLSIGMVEELVKLIPVLIVIRSKKIINESYDYLFYASVSALGFAFIENILYINSSQLYSVIARLLMASVAHMTFTTTILYGVLLSKYRFTRIPNIFIYIGFFILASLSHGFYDFWLINHWASQYQGLTMIFFIVSMHIWFTMLNNGINTSAFYNRAIPLRVDKIKAYLIYSLLIVFMSAFLVVGVLHGKEAANLFFWSNMVSFGYFFIYIIYSHNRFKIVRGYIAPIEATSNFFIPPLKQNH